MEILTVGPLDLRDEERKVVSVLFVDLVGFTARAEAGESVVAGDVVNTASRLQQVAAPGTAVVGERTYEATRTAVDYEELERVTVKGKAAPLRIWRALGVRSFAEDVEPARR